jgi:hypothetical protein
MASEKFTHYYFRDEDVRVLTPQLKDSGWYFLLIKNDVEQYIDVGYHKGDLSNPYLYVDIKLNEISNQKMGYVGMAIPLHSALNEIHLFEQKFGVGLHFVNNDQMVILSPDSLSVNKPLKDASWYNRNSKLLPKKRWKILVGIFILKMKMQLHQ